MISVAPSSCNELKLLLMSFPMNHRTMGLVLVPSQVAQLTQESLTSYNLAQAMTWNAWGKALVPTCAKLRAASTGSRSARSRRFETCETLRPRSWVGTSWNYNSEEVLRAITSSSSRLDGHSEQTKNSGVTDRFGAASKASLGVIGEQLKATAVHTNCSSS